MSLKSKIPFFDLDWTLIKGGSPIHKKAMLNAILKTFSVKTSFRSLNPHGLTDSKILFELAHNLGVNKSKILNKLPNLIKLTNKYFLKNSKNERFLLMPGSRRLFSILKSKNIPIGILTGNTKAVGQEKLKKTNLFKYIDYEIYGDMSLDRSDLVKYAQKLVSKDYPKITTSQIVIVGDTPKDIVCAKKNGAQVIALATGKYKQKDLQGADLILNTLNDNKKLISFLLK